jgi:hypothetical protein
MRKKVLITAFIISFLIIPFLIHAQVYKWTDDKGTIHFTDDYSNVPEKYLPLAETQRLPKETPLSAAEQKSASAPKSSESMEQEIPRLFSGLITGVDASARTVTVTGEGKEIVFSISAETTIKTDYGKNLSLSELKNGRPATIEYIEKDGELRARSIIASILQAGATNAVQNDPEGKPNPGPGQLENPGKTQEGVWGDQQGHQTIQDGTPTGKPTKPPQFKLPKKSSK